MFTSYVFVRNICPKGALVPKGNNFFVDCKKHSRIVDVLRLDINTSQISLIGAGGSISLRYWLDVVSSKRKRFITNINLISEITVVVIPITLIIMPHSTSWGHVLFHRPNIQKKPYKSYYFISTRISSIPLIWFKLVPYK